MSKKASVFLISIIFHIQTRKCTKLFTENIMKYFAHVQTVCTRLLLGGKGPGDEARSVCVIRITTIETIKRLLIGLAEINSKIAATHKTMI